MTRSQRRRRTAQRHARRSSFPLARPAIAVGIALDENPNRVKLGAARLAFMEGFISELADAESKAYAPLTVTTPARDSLGRRNPRMAPSSYTV